MNEGTHMSDTNGKFKQNIVSETVGALALSYLEQTLKSGKSVSIPSLGIIIEGDKSASETLAAQTQVVDKK
jgi:hypothetical protein